MRIHVVTLFPEMFEGPFGASIIGRAAAGGLVEFALHQLRDHTHDRHRTVDDEPYGGGPGMVMKVDVVVPAVEAVLSEDSKDAKPRLLAISINTWRVAFFRL